MYRCRCCGEVFAHSVTRGMSTKVISVFTDFNLGNSVSDSISGSPTQTVIHYCDEDTLGYADFIGVTAHPEKFARRSVE